MIKTGGFSVDPVEVEKAILGFPGVREAAVVGAPDEHWGEVVVAFVAGLRRADRGRAARVREVAAQRASSARSASAFLESLPKNPTGKIERGRLRELASEQV